MVARLSSLVVDRETSLQTAMQTIDENGEGVAFVVDDAGKLVGIATDGDIRRGLLKGVGLSDPIEHVMNEDPVVARNSWDDKELAQNLVEGGVTSLSSDHKVLLIPVLDDEDRPVGRRYVDSQGHLVDGGEPVSRDVGRVLVIGGAGYIGSVLTRELLDEGYAVRVLDNGTYGTGGIESIDDARFEYVEGDMRSIETVVESVDGVDAVVHLGALVGDPASDINPQKTLEINYHAVRMAAEVCKYHQTNRFIFASTCSVYGKAETESTLLTERSSLNPVSLYAKSKIEAERAILDLADQNFHPTIFRMATVYGLSPRMRFDLVVNILSAKAHTEGVIPIYGGDQYRPLVHVRDVARAYIDCLETPIEAVSGEVFNVGSTEQNYRVIEVGNQVSEAFPEAEISRDQTKEDERSYRVDFSKAQQVLGFDAEHTIVDASREIRRAFEDGRFGDYTDCIYNNYKTLEDNPLIEP